MVAAKIQNSRGVLLRGARDLARHIGLQTSYHQPEDQFFFRSEFIPEFEALSPYPITRPDRYWALIAKGDPVSPTEDPAFFVLWIIQAAPEAVKPAHQKLIRSPAYAALKDETKDGISEAVMKAVAKEA